MSTHGRRIAILAAAAVLVAACSSGEDASTTTTTTPATTAVAPATTAVPTTVTSTTAPSTTAAPTTTEAPTTTAAPTTTTEPCRKIGSTKAVTAGFPATLSTVYGASIRTVSRPCSERIVIEFAGQGEMPGTWVRYTDGPITLGQSDDQIVELKGKADLLINVGAWMGSMDDDSLWGLRSVTPTGVKAIRQLYLVDNSEGVMIWAVGLDKVRSFRVTTVSDPARLVIDISTP